MICGFIQSAATSSFRYLLDEFGTDLHIGLALCKLSASYSGSCIRVRRSSDNTEQDIGFDGDWLDEAALLSFCGSGNGFVHTRYDQSGGGRDFLNTTNSEQPQIVASGSIYTKNGKPAIYYGGGVKKLKLASYSPVSTAQFYSVHYLDSDTSVMWSKNAEGSFYLAVAENGSGSTPDGNAGSPSYFVNGSSVSATRDSLYDNQINVQKLLSIRSVATNAGAWTNLIDSYDFGGYEYGGYRQLDVIYHSHTEARADIEALINENYGIF